ncbi:MAG: DUF1513 domain-containing protein [Rhodoferax sp.]|nr:MAG: DUF1513 domain-containing protein [Rhodoferax sp.]
MQKRDFLALVGMSLGWGWSATAGAAALSEPTGKVALATAGANIVDGQVQAYWVGVMQPDWSAQRMLRTAVVPVPSRAHGLAALPDGGFVAVANRPGRWLARLDAQAQVQNLLTTHDAVRTFEGHVVVSADGQWLYTTETDPRTGQGWVSVRDVRSLQTVSEFRTGGSEPHQLLLDATGSLVVANGGVLRAPGDRKIELHRMDSSLVRIRPENGERLGQWRLADRRLGLRHMAWNTPLPGQAPLLGIVMQNEHEDALQRRQSPLLALWDGTQLQLPAAQGLGDGYAGDIAPTRDGGFLISSQRAGVVVQWSPQQPETTRVVAQLKEAGALVALQGGVPGSDVLMSSLNTAGRWSMQEPGGLLAWPQGVQVDNHWVRLAQS